MATDDLRNVAAGTPASASIATPPVAAVPRQASATSPHGSAVSTVPAHDAADTERRARLRQAASVMKEKTTAGAARLRATAPDAARRTAQTARANPRKVSAGLLAAVGSAVLALLAYRRRNARLRAAARSRWVPGFVRR